MESKSLSHRNSSIELLKVFAIILIVISHVVQTLGSSFDFLPFNSYVLNFSAATTDPKILILALLRHSGAWGNTIFFICSAWFFIDEDKVNYRKMLNMLLDVWFVSVIIFIIVSAFGNLNLSWKDALHQFLPNFYSNNWYITCYVLFYLFHDKLNLIIESLNQRRHFRVASIMAILYIAINFIQGGHFASSELIVWMTIYFCIAYMKKYMADLSNNIKFNIYFAIIMFACHIGLVCFTNLLGLRLSFFEKYLLHWNGNNNPFLILATVGMLNIARNTQFESKTINYISKLSLLIYITTENLLLRQYYRPRMWQYVYDNFGYTHILFWVLILVIIVFVFGLLSSIVYHHTIQKIVSKISEKLYGVIKSIWIKLEDTVVNNLK